MTTTYKTLKALKSHPGVRMIETGAKLRHAWNPDTRVCVSLKPGWFNYAHAVNVVLGTNAAEALAFFNRGDVREVARELIHTVRAMPEGVSRVRAAYSAGQCSVGREDFADDESYESTAHRRGVDAVFSLLVTHGPRTAEVVSFEAVDTMLNLLGV
jgi:hypothetical protein